MKIIFCGDRNWKNAILVGQVMGKLRDYLGDFTVIQGCARGADTCAFNMAVWQGLPHEEFPADWDKHGKAAGPIRNRQMVNEGKANAVVAFHNDIQSSKGTKDMVKYALEKELPVHIVSEEIGLEGLSDFIAKLT